MADSKIERVAKILKVLSHPTRIKIIYLLSQQGEISRAQLDNRMAVGRGSIANHLFSMSSKGIIHSKRRGREVYYTLEDPAFTEWLTVALQVGQKHRGIL